MNPLGRRILETIHLTALALWLGGLAMTGVLAAIIFPTMKELDPSLPAYAPYEGEHWRIAAGKVANTGFLVIDAVGIGALLVSLAMLGALGLWRWLDFSKPATILRLVALGAAIATMAWSLGVLRPRMQENLTAFWQAARAGDNEAADRHQAAFSADHPRASLTMTVQFVTVGWAFVAGCFGATGSPRPSRETGP